MFFLASRGYRCIAHDRRGHGRSSQPWHGNDLDTYADDLAELTEQLALKGAIHVGHSTGGGEVVRYLARHGSGRVSKAVLIGAIPPLMLKTAANPGGLPLDVFDGIRAGVLGDRSQFFKDLSLPFYGYNRPGAQVSEGVRNGFWLQGMAAGMPAAFFVRQGVLGNRPDRRPEKNRRADFDPSWRRRPDRADRRLGTAFVQAHQERQAACIPRRSPRYLHDGEGSRERGPSRVYQRGISWIIWSQHSARLAHPDEIRSDEAARRDACDAPLERKWL